MPYVVKFKIGDKQKYLRLEYDTSLEAYEPKPVNREVQATIFYTRAQVLRLLAQHSTALAAMEATELPTTKEEVEANESQAKYSGRKAATKFHTADGRHAMNLDPTIGFGEDPPADPEDPEDCEDF